MPELIWAVFSAGALGALAYGFIYLFRPLTLVRAIVKTSAIGALALGVALAGGHPLLVAALALSALGDFALAFDKKVSLPLGIGAFLIAQLIYAFLFAHLMTQTEPLLARIAASGAIALAALGYLAWLWPKLGALKGAIIPYAGAIAAMAALSFWLEWRAWPAMLGAVLFMISDGVLAAELFKLAPDAPARRITAPVVWWTYVAAQALIAWGVLLALA